MLSVPYESWPAGIIAATETASDGGPKMFRKKHFTHYETLDTGPAANPPEQHYVDDYWQDWAYSKWLGIETYTDGITRRDNIDTSGWVLLWNMTADDWTILTNTDTEVAVQHVWSRDWLFSLDPYEVLFYQYRRRTWTVSLGRNRTDVINDAFTLYAHTRRRNGIWTWDDDEKVISVPEANVRGLGGDPDLVWGFGVSKTFGLGTIYQGAPIGGGDRWERYGWIGSRFQVPASPWEQLSVAVGWDGTHTTQSPTEIACEPGTIYRMEPGFNNQPRTNTQRKAWRDDEPRPKPA